MKIKTQIMGRVAASAMAFAMSVTALPVSAAEMPAPSDEQEKTVESEETLEPESGIIDTTAPTLKEVTLSKAKVTQSESIEVIVDATDDFSGVNSIFVLFSNDRNSMGVVLSKTYYDENLKQTVEYADGKWHGTLETTVRAPGVYSIAIDVKDVAGNIASYDSTQLPENTEITSVLIEEGNVQLPKLTKLSFEKTTLKPSEKMTVKAQLEGNTANIKGIAIGFRDSDLPRATIYADLEPDQDGGFSGSLTVLGNVKEDNYYFKECIVYEGDDSGYLMSNAADEVYNMTFHVVNDLPDTTPPELKSFALGADAVDAPGHLEFTAEASDASGIDSVVIYFRPESVGVLVPSSIAYSEDGKTVTGSIDVNQYTGSGEVYIDLIRVYDKAGNIQDYSNQNNHQPFPANITDLSFRVNNDADTAAVITSTVSPTLLSDIQNAADDAVIHVDISSDKVMKKAVFDAVKGTNKTLLLNSNDIQWVVKGTDVNGQTKDVDLNGVPDKGYAEDGSNLYTMLDKHNYLGITLADNAELPCKVRVRLIPESSLLDEVGRSNLYVYRYNEAEGKLEAVASNISLTKENHLEFEITRGGNYIIVNGPAKSTAVEPDDKPTEEPTEDPDAIPDGPTTWVGQNGTEGFVNRLYNVALCRESEEGGFNDWNNRLETKTETAAEVAQGFIFSDEFKNKDYNNRQFVKILYRTMFGREADEGGLDGWVDDLENGMSREYVYRGFAESEEFTNLCGNYDVVRGSVTLSAYRDQNKGATGFIARLYTKMLGRGFDEAGIEDWCGKYLRGEYTIENIATDGFLHSQELQNQNLSNEEFVKRMYQTFLNREPDQAGMKDWVHRLETGEVTRDTLVYGFTNSKEFANIKAEYGL